MKWRGVRTKAGNTGPVSTRAQAQWNTDYWSSQLVSMCYKTIVINFAVVVAFWYFFALKTSELSPAHYWLRYIVAPIALMLIANIAADTVVRSAKASVQVKKYTSVLLLLFFCTLLCLQYSILAVLMTTFLIPIVLSTLYADVTITRRTYCAAQVLLIPIAWRMNTTPTRSFGPWIWAEMLTASGLLLAAYFLSKVLITHGRDFIFSLKSMQFNLNSIQHDKSKLEEELRLDPLTSLYNRKAYNEYFPHIMEECRRTDASLSIAVLDIDDFKKVNDVYGHAAGDIVLLRFASILKQIVHERVYAFRVGGEEFVLLFQDYSVRAAADICENVLALTKDTPFPELSGHTVSFSGGVAEMERLDAEPNELFKLADDTLYSAKKSGKNKIMVCNSAVL